jgi:putative ABC transport system permease protein
VHAAYGMMQAVTSMSTTPSADWRLAVVLVVLTGAAVACSRLGGLGVEREQAVAAARAVLQLAAVSAVIAWVLRSVTWSLGFVLLMSVVATLTSTRRLGLPVSAAPWVGVAVGAGAAPVVALCLGSGVVPFNGPGVLPVAGIIIGGAMTAATLTGRRAFQEMQGQAGTYEAALAVGLSSLQATRLVVEPSAREALVPGIDQTRTVGLVTLPGAFIGVLLGGGTAIEAGAAQVLVLVGLLAAQAATSAVMLHLIADRRVMRDDLRALPR